jgi:sialidase-1
MRLARRTFGLLVLTSCLGSPATLAADPLVSATSSQRVHPVLSRNDHNEALEIVVDVKSDEPVRPSAARFTLEGTDDVNDFASLELFVGGMQPAFAPGVSFGKASPAARTVEFVGERTLEREPNVFWLSCRLKPDAGLSHRVGAVCTSIETTAGVVRPANLTPGRPHRIGVALRKHNDDGVDTYRIPALATTPKGALLGVYDLRRRMGRDLQEDIDIGLSRNTDGGRSWEPARVAMDMGEYDGLPQSQNGCSDPGIIVDGRTGEISCFAVWMNGKPGKHQWTGDGSEPGFEIGKSAQSLMVRSRDDGRTRSRPENLTRALKKPEWWLLAPSPHQGINLPDGTLVMPAQGRDAQGKEFTTMLTSVDHGGSWSVGAPAYSSGSECQAAMLGDGSIMLDMRNEHERFRAVSVTPDLGRTWQAHPTSRNTLIEPNCNASFLRVDLPGNPSRRTSCSWPTPIRRPPGRIRRSRSVSTTAGPGPSPTTGSLTKAEAPATRASPGSTTATSGSCTKAAGRSSCSRRFPSPSCSSPRLEPEGHTRSATRKRPTTPVCTSSSTTAGSPNNRA